MVNLFCIKIDNAPPIGKYYKNGDDMEDNQLIEAIQGVQEDTT